MSEAEPAMAVHQVDTASLSGLGLRDTDLATIEQALRRGRGVVFVCGPPHSGRSSALYSLLCALNDESHSLASAERNLRHKIPGVSQSEVGPDDTLAEWLRVISRADPDVLMVSAFDGLHEALVLTRAAARALVLAGSVADSSLVPLCRLMELGASPRVVCHLVTCVISARLVPRLCPYCRVVVAGHTGLLTALRETFEVDLPERAYEAPGCDRCEGTGRRGQVGLYEVNEVGPQLESILSGDYTGAALEEAGLRTTLTGIVADALAKSNAGLLDLRDLSPLLAQWTGPGDAPPISDN